MLQEDKLQEECGVFGIWSDSTQSLGESMYMGLLSLQHRGEESCGIYWTDNEKSSLYKDKGKVCEVFTENILNNIKGHGAIGHVRYCTFGSNDILSAQPLVESINGEKIALVHNGNIVNASAIKNDLIKEGTVFKCSSDSEVIIKLIKKHIHRGIEEALLKITESLKGSYSILILFKDKLVAFRDPLGIRPLCIGKKDNYYILSSESCAIDTIGASFIRDILPGEMVVVDKKGVHTKRLFNCGKSCICAFEYVYFAKENSVIDTIDIGKFRREIGKELFKEFLTTGDIVVGVPDSAMGYALGYSGVSTIPLEMAFVKNKYIGRTFISSGDKEKLVKLKLSVIKSSVQGKRVIVVDDSLVRGTTSKILVKQLRNAGAKEVHLRIASPFIKHPCSYGIDIKTHKELLACEFSKEQMRDFIGADTLEYLSIDRLKKVLGNYNKFCLGCFTGEYPKCKNLIKDLKENTD